MADTVAKLQKRVETVQHRGYRHTKEGTDRITVSRSPVQQMPDKILGTTWDVPVLSVFHCSRQTRTAMQNYSMQAVTDAQGNASYAVRSE